MPNGEGMPMRNPIAKAVRTIRPQVIPDKRQEYAIQNQIEDMKALKADSHRLGGKIQCPTCQGAGWTKATCHLPSMKELQAIARVAPNTPLVTQRDNCRRCDATGYIEQQKQSEVIKYKGAYMTTAQYQDYVKSVEWKA